MVIKGFLYNSAENKWDSQAAFFGKYIHIQREARERKGGGEGGGVEMDLCGLGNMERLLKDLLWLY